MQDTYTFDQVNSGRSSGQLVSGEPAAKDRAPQGGAAHKNMVLTPVERALPARSTTRRSLILKGATCLIAGAYLSGCANHPDSPENRAKGESERPSGSGNY